MVPEPSYKMEEAKPGTGCKRTHSPGTRPKSNVKHVVNRWQNTISIRHHTIANTGEHIPLSKAHNYRRPCYTRLRERLPITPDTLRLYSIFISVHSTAATSVRV